MLSLQYQHEQQWPQAVLNCVSQRYQLLPVVMVCCAQLSIHMSSAVCAEFHAVFDLACPGLLGDIKAFNRRYEGPIQRGRDADATENQVKHSHIPCRLVVLV